MADAGKGDLARVKNHRLAWMSLTVLATFTISVFVHYVLGRYRSMPYPFDTFLFDPRVHFTDFFDDYRLAQQMLLDHAGDRLTYFPLPHLVMTVLTLIPAVPAFFLMVASFFTTLYYMLRRLYTDRLRGPLMAQTMLVLGALSYPVLFALDRGNEEMILFVLLFWFFFFYYVRPKPRAAALLLGAAIAYKVYPAVLLVLYVTDKRYREALWSIAWAVGLTAGSVVALAAWLQTSPAVIVDLVRANTRYMQEMYAFTPAGSYYRHGLWALVMRNALLAGDQAALRAAQLPYLAAALGAGLLLAFYVWKYETERWKRATVLVIAAILLPYYPADYTLLHVFLPAMLFLNSRSRSRLDAVYAVMFGLLLGPLDFIRLEHNFTIAIYAYPAVLLGIIGLIVAERFVPGLAAAKLPPVAADEMEQAS